MALQLAVPLDAGAFPHACIEDLRGTDAAPSDAQLAQFAVAALIEEAQLTPKPALVDARGSGAHRDLDLPLMLRSARALEPTFATLAHVSRDRVPSATLRTELAQIGRAGEHDMMRATNGSNAHRGAIWIVGLLVAGAAIASGDAHAPGAPRTSHAHSLAVRVCGIGAQIACFPDRFAAPADSHGERVRKRYHVGGARQEAQDGFPHVIGVGLPALHGARAKGIGAKTKRASTTLLASRNATAADFETVLEAMRAGQIPDRALNT
ncbi:triphosphoribosyl-dephospho-CoA synthase, partial [Paraburkholderia bengalensis]